MLVKAQVNYTVQSTTIADEAMRQLQQLRAKAWDDNLPYYGKTLREYAKSVGVTSRDEYVYGPTWDSTCEANSQMRIEELFNTGQFDHRRPNGTYMSDFGFGEGLYAYTNPIYLGEAMYDWGYAEIPDLKSVNGKFTEANSHLHNLIDPEYKAFSFAILNINDGSYNYAVFHASYDQGDQSFLGDDTIYYQDEAATTTTEEAVITTHTYSTEPPAPATPAPTTPIAEEGVEVDDADLEAAIIDALEDPTTNPETVPTETPQDSPVTDTSSQAIETTQAEVAPATSTEVTPTTESVSTTVVAPSKPSSTTGDIPSRPITNTSTRPTGTGITKPQSKLMSTPTMPKQSSSSGGSSSSSSHGGTNSGSNKESDEESELESASHSTDETNQEDESQEPYLIDLVECYEFSLTSLDYIKTIFMSAF